MPFKLIILGSNSAIPTTKRFQTAQVLKCDNNYYLIDCGECTQIRLREHKINFNKIKAIFISHLHGDHFFGIFGLMFTMHLLRRTNPLHIIAQSELKKLIDLQIEISNISLSYELIFISTDTANKQKLKTIYKDDKITVDTFPLKHTIPCNGYLFKENPKPLKIKKELIAEYNIPIETIRKIKNGEDFISPSGNIIPNQLLTISPPTSTYAFITDTIFDIKHSEYIKNVKLLYHEATFLDEHITNYESHGHSSAKQAAFIAQNANAEKLIIGHFSNIYKTYDKLLNEAQTIFKNTELALENDIFEF